jgi:signal transduction histidine kinase
VIEIEDRCGGLPQGDSQELFKPFVQRGSDRPGFGLGLAIVEQSIKAHGGLVTVRNLPGKGCVFSLELPHSPLPESIQSNPEHEDDSPAPP